HTTRLLSLDNVFDAEGLVAWGASVERRLGRAPAGGFTVEPKIDGAAVGAPAPPRPPRAAPAPPPAPPAGASTPPPPRALAPPRSGMPHSVVSHLGSVHSAHPTDQEPITSCV
ncbi:hypothetical protein ACFXPJ_07705, partial [Streptomyces goshikiensis]